MALRRGESCGEYGKGRSTWSTLPNPALRLPLRWIEAPKWTGGGPGFGSPGVANRRYVAPSTAFLVPYPPRESQGFERPMNAEPPALPAYPWHSRSGAGLKVRCEHCRKWHYHGTGYGHRVAHCFRDDSPYRRGGYVLVAPEDA